MDYTTVARVKLALGASEETDDSLLGSIVVSVSRAMDRMLSGRADCSNYLQSESKTETLRGRVDKDGRILCHPLKPRISSVASFAYRATPLDGWQSVDVNRLSISGYAVTAFTSLTGRDPQFVQITYTGGLAAAVADLPADILDAADILAVRFYREIKSGLGDAIGLAETGEMIYTKAWPVRVLEMLAPYKRKI